MQLQNICAGRISLRESRRDLEDVVVYADCSTVLSAPHWHESDHLPSSKSYSPCTFPTTLISQSISWYCHFRHMYGALSGVRYSTRAAESLACRAARSGRRRRDSASCSVRSRVGGQAIDNETATKVSFEGCLYRIHATLIWPAVSSNDRKLRQPEGLKLEDRLRRVRPSDSDAPSGIRHVYVRTLSGSRTRTNECMVQSVWYWQGSVV